LIDSPIVYMYDGTTLVAVNIETSNYEVKKHVQDKVFNLEIDVVFSLENKRQRQ
jgi:hypothetical protein